MKALLKTQLHQEPDTLLALTDAAYTYTLRHRYGIGDNAP